jgi:flagellar protein FlaI
MIKDLGMRMLFKKAEKGRLSPSKLSFFLEDIEHGETIKEVRAGIDRYIVRSGNVYSYLVGERKIDGSDRVLMELAKACVIEKLANLPDDSSTSLFNAAREIAYNEMLRRTDQERAGYLAYFVAHDTAGTGPFSIFMEDRGNIEEIEVNSATSPITIYSTSCGRCSTNIRFTDENAFRHCLNKFISENEKELGEASPIIDAQVSEARVHAQMKPYALAGAVASVRIGKGKSLGIYSLLKNGALSLEALTYLWLAIDAKMNIVISGAPASGKTTMLGGIANLIPSYSKLVTIEEEINELKFSEPIFNIVSLHGSKYGETNTRSQVINALRMRPDRIVVGEIRGEEARELFSGANLGIPFITTMHSGEEGLAIIKKLLIKPMMVETRSLSMLDLSIYMKQSGIRSRIISTIQEYRWLSRAEIKEGIEVGDGDSVENKIVANEGRTTEEVIFDSKAFLRYMKENGITPKAARKEVLRRISFLKSSFSKSKSDEEMVQALLKYRRGIVDE